MGKASLIFYHAHPIIIKGLIIWSFFIPRWNFNLVCRVEIFTIIWEVSSRMKSSFILALMKINFWINGIFCFHPEMKLKLGLYGESFNSGSASRDEIFTFLHVIVICFLYWKQWQGEMKFQPGCVIIISSWDEIFHIMIP